MTDTPTIWRVWLAIGLVAAYGVSVKADRGYLKTVIRGRVGRRKTPLPRLAGVWLLYAVEDVWAAGFRRNERRGRADQHCFPPNPIIFGRDPNDLTNAIGRLPNDRPHMFRLMGSVDVPHTGVAFAANLQYFSGKPWAATTQVMVPQSDNQRVQLEPRGSRRLSSQSLLDLRVSRIISFRGVGRVEVLVDLLNVLNDNAEEGLATDNLFSPNFGQGVAFVDPRRAMVSARVNLGR
jgi:hypothetical protein